jgi:hypothetical protein
VGQDTSQLKLDTAQILDEIARLRSHLPDEVQHGRSEILRSKNMILDQYLDNLTSYAESIIADDETFSSDRRISPSARIDEQLSDVESNEPDMDEEDRAHRDDVGYPDLSFQYYEAWCLRRASPKPGHGATWAKVTISKMGISSDEIAASYHKHIKTQSDQVIKQYNILKSDKMRTAIDKVVYTRNLNKQDRNFEWQLVHLDISRRPLKGTLGNSAVETTQIVVILKRTTCQVPTFLKLFPNP